MKAACCWGKKKVTSLVAVHAFYKIKYFWLAYNKLAFSKVISLYTRRLAMNVKLIAIMHCNIDAEETFEQELKRLVETSVNDEGCLKYELYQYENEPCRYVILEEWQDEQALKKHQET